VKAIEEYLLSDEDLAMIDAVEVKSDGRWNF